MDTQIGYIPPMYFPENKPVFPDFPKGKCENESWSDRWKEWLDSILDWSRKYIEWERRKNEWNRQQQYFT